MQASRTDQELADLVAAFSKLAAATVYEGLRKALGRYQSLDPAIRPLISGGRLCGPAHTVQTPIGSLLPIVRAAETAPAGSVVVVEAGGTPRATAWGGSLSLYCVLHGIAGCVTNASVRDLAEIRALEFPVFAPGVSVRGAIYDHGEGAIGVPVAVGEVVVFPGDIVIGDDDDVVVVPISDAPGVLRYSQDQKAEEDAREQLLRNGQSISEVLGLSKHEPSS